MCGSSRAMRPRPQPRPSGLAEVFAVLGASLGLVLLLGQILGCSQDEGEGPICPGAGHIFLVEPDGTGMYATIAAAIEAAGSGDIIELADGTFTGAGNRDLDFAGKPITLRSRSGEAAACTLDCQGDSLNQHRAFTFHSGEGAGSVVEGLTITGGRAVGHDPPYDGLLTRVGSLLYPGQLRGLGRRGTRLRVRCQPGVGRSRLRSESRRLRPPWQFGF
jgi:hypothetical protein